MTSAEIGVYGERVAAAFLRQRGYKFLTRNFHSVRGEIDLICRHKDMLVFVEVRTRSNEEFGRPIESIGEDKKEALRRTARRYLQLLDDSETILYRFDAVEVTYVTGQIPACTLIENFFA